MVEISLTSGIDVWTEKWGLTMETEDSVISIKWSGVVPLIGALVEALTEHIEEKIEDDSLL
jgi:hypothetical protein